MNTLTAVEPARHTDLNGLVSLLASSTPDCASQTVWDLPWQWPNYRVVRKHDNVVAAASLTPVADQRSEIRGLAVDPRFRGKGLARQLVSSLVDAAAERGHETVCVTTSPDFFGRLGFARVHPFWLDLQPARRPLGECAGDRVTMIATESRLQEQPILPSVSVAATGHPPRRLVDRGIEP